MCYITKREQFVNMPISKSEELTGGTTASKLLMRIFSLTWKQTGVTPVAIKPI
jgi:hypothetical protein